MSLHRASSLIESITMKLFSVFCILFISITASFAINCDRLACPEEAITCNINFAVHYASKTKTNNATCIDENGKQ